MSTSQAIRERIAAQPAGEPFTPALFAGLGSRASIDQTLMRLTKEGFIERLGRGLYTVPKTSRFGLKSMPSPETVAQTVAAAEGASIEVHGAEAARRFGFSTQVPAQPVFYTTGSSHTVRMGKLQVRLQHVAARKLALAGRPAGQALSALWYLGRRQVTPATFERIAAKLPPAFQGSEWQEIRLDIDPTNEPDIVGSMLDLAAVADASMDAIYSAHNIEHVYAHEVPKVLKEFLRVLKLNGFLIVTCPDLQSVCQLVAEDKLGDAAYTSQAGPITPLDMLYGHGDALAHGHHYMAHKTGFTLKILMHALSAAGFASIAGKRRLRELDIWVVASRGAIEEAALKELAEKVLPG